MANETPVTSSYLMKGAVFALEECGTLLQGANCLYRNGSYASAVVLAHFAREEMGRTGILFDLRSEYLSGENITIQTITDRCTDHRSKQESGIGALEYRTDNSSGLGKLLKARMTVPVGSPQWRELDQQIRDLDERKRKRLPDDRHQQRMLALYVQPDASGAGWNRPCSTGKETAKNVLTETANPHCKGSILGFFKDTMSSYTKNCLTGRSAQHRRYQNGRPSKMTMLLVPAGGPILVGSSQLQSWVCLSPSWPRSTTSES